MNNPAPQGSGEHKLVAENVELDSLNLGDGEPLYFSDVTYFIQNPNTGRVVESTDPYRRDYVSYQDFTVLKEALQTVLARESATAARYDARLAEVEAARDQALTLGADQVLEIQELRQVVKEYRDEHTRNWYCVTKNNNCPICIKADALLEPKAKPTQQGDKE